MTTLEVMLQQQGTTIVMGALASQPDLAARISVAALMAPVASVRHMTSQPLVALAALDTDALFTLLGVREFAPSVQVRLWHHVL